MKCGIYYNPETNGTALLRTNPYYRSILSPCRFFTHMVVKLNGASTAFGNKKHIRAQLKDYERICKL